RVAEVEADDLDEVPVLDDLVVDRGAWAPLELDVRRVRPVGLRERLRDEREVALPQEVRLRPDVSRAVDEVGVVELADQHSRSRIRAREAVVSLRLSDGREDLHLPPGQVVDRVRRAVTGAIDVGDRRARLAFPVEDRLATRAERGAAAVPLDGA